MTEGPELDARYWQSRYLASSTPWDIGAPSPPLIRYLGKLKDRDLRILIPGAGHAHEAGWLFQAGFSRVTVCDWAPLALERFHQQYPDFPEQDLMVHDFFTLDRSFDLILEQTFFCALPPDRRSAYVQQCHHLLSPGGRVAGLLFASVFDRPGPPFGGEAELYRDLFSPYFHILEMEIAPDSIPPRQGNELFFCLQAREDVLPKPSGSTDDDLADVIEG